MKKNILKALPVIIFTPFLWAQGALTNDCEIAKEIQNPVNSGGFFMSQDCKTAYVLPPQKGLAEVNGKTTGDLGRCAEVKTFVKSLKESSEQIGVALKNRQSDEEVKKLLEHRKLLLGQYSDLANTIGASIELIFSMNTGDVVRRYQEMNQDIGVAFMPTTIKEAKLNWKDDNEKDPDIKLSFNRSVGISGNPNTGAGSFSAKLNLTMYGACQLRDPFTKKMPEKLRFRDVAGLIAPTVTYKYDVGAKFSYTAQVSRGALARQIKETSTSGGFFKTSTASSLIESNSSESWFKFTMTCDDARVCDQAKTETALQIKQRLMNEVLENIMLAKIGIPVVPYTPAEPGKNGASVAVKALREECPHIYCQVGAVILDIASSTFGGTSKTDTYIKTESHFVEEKVEVNTPVAIFGMMGFGG